MIKAANIVAATAFAQYTPEILTQNAKTWDSAIVLIPTTGFEPTAGLNVRGEIGWHTHGTGDIKDTDIDFAIILEAEETIDPSYTTMVLWGLPLGEEGLVTDEIKYEVGYFGYKRGTLSDPEIWNLKQVLCSGYQGSSVVLFN